jgi:hypothetical protein
MMMDLVRTLPGAKHEAFQRMRQGPLRQDPRPIGYSAAFESVLHRSGITGAQSKAPAALQILQLHSICEAS